MTSMKRITIVVGGVFLAVYILVVLLGRRKQTNDLPTGANETIQIAPPFLAESGLPKLPVKTVIRATELTESERNQFHRDFEAHMKPALERWGTVYDGRIPFSLDEVTPEKLHSRLHSNLFTFMIGDTTLTILHSAKKTRVQYMMTSQGARALNSLPVGGQPPDLSAPLGRTAVSELLKADSGISYPPDQIQIRHTGASGALGGGISVEAGGITGNGVFRHMTLTNLDFVVGPDGKLVYYLH